MIYSEYGILINILVEKCYTYKMVHYQNINTNRECMTKTNTQTIKSIGAQ